MKILNFLALAFFLFFSTGLLAQDVCDNDTTPPVAICINGLVVELGSNGEVTIFAEDFNENSYDDCSDVTLSFFQNSIDMSLVLTANTSSPAVVSLWVTDASGNQNSCWTEITIEDNGQVGDCTNDNQAPVAICNDLTNLSLDANNEASLSVEILDSGSFDNCSMVTLSFSELSLVTTMDFDASSSSSTNVSLYVSDASGNQSVCWGVVSLSNGETSESVFGYVKTEAGQSLAGISVKALDANGQDVQVVTTDADGRYEFFGLAVGVTYTIQPEKNTSPINGVTTFDVVLGRRHILGIDLLNSPYRLYAADVNNSNSLTTFDLVVMRKLILGYDAEFADNLSWKFVRSTAVFSTPGQVEHGPITGNSFEISVGESNASFDFIGMKTGDLNGTASTNL